MEKKFKREATNLAEIMRNEEKISKKRAAELFDKGLGRNYKAGSFYALSLIHKYLFEGVFDFAGMLREENISKGSFRFTPALYLREAVESVEHMPQSDFDEIIEKYVEMNIAHPFKDGNGRSMRIWLDIMLKTELGKVVDWSKVDKEDYLLAMERSPVRDTEIKHILKAALTDKIDDREIYINGIDYSFYYEGYFAFRTSEL